MLKFLFGEHIEVVTLLIVVKIFGSLTIFAKREISASMLILENS